MNIRRQIGILRSLVIYYLKPFQIRRMKHFYGTFLREGDLCFDIGAHVGNRTSVWKHLGARVVCVEPQGDLFNYLERRFGTDEKVTLINCAVGRSPGRGELHVSYINPSVHTLADKAWREALNRSAGPKGRWDATEQVKVCTIEQLIEQHGMPDFCKMDVEGWEAEVLRALSCPIPKLSFECLQTAVERALECIQTLESLGPYSYNLSMGESMQWVFNECIGPGEMIRYIRTEFPENKSGDIYAFLQE